MDEKPAPAEYLSIPELGIKNAFVLHLRNDTDPRR